MMDFFGAALPLTNSGLLSVCNRLGVKTAEIWAVVFVETDYPYGGFWPDRRPQILYEQHVFHRLTGARFDASNPDISSDRPGNYGASGSHQYDRLNLAIALDEAAALQSASWGIGQTLGDNFHMVGYASPREMVNAMIYSEDAQLLAAANEMAASGAADALRAHDWTGFARIYNGPAYAKNHYDQNLMSQYMRLASGGQPDVRIRTAQMYLMYLHYDPRELDGSFGDHTRSAMQAFQSDQHLPISDDLDDATFARIVEMGQQAPPVPRVPAVMARRTRRRS